MSTGCTTMHVYIPNAFSEHRQGNILDPGSATYMLS